MNGINNFLGESLNTGSSSRVELGGFEKVKELIIIWRILKSQKIFTERDEKEEVKEMSKERKRWPDRELSGKTQKLLILRDR